jgi:hypothetical protein
MKRVMKKISAGLVVVGVMVAIGSAASSMAAGPFGCFRKGIYCLDVWQPVICSDGNVYSNGCYAYRACATNCVPYGGDTF